MKWTLLFLLAGIASAKLVGVSIQFPDGVVVTDVINLSEDATAKDALIQAGYKTSWSYGGGYLDCIEDFCGRSEDETWWDFVYHHNNETSWTLSPVGIASYVPIAGDFIGFRFLRGYDCFSSFSQDKCAPPFISFPSITVDGNGDDWMGNFWTIDLGDGMNDVSYFDESWNTVLTDQIPWADIVGVNVTTNGTHLFVKLNVKNLSPPNTTSYRIYLDIDQNPNTGCGFRRGAEYALEYLFNNSTWDARLLRYDPNAPSCPCGYPGEFIEVGKIEGSHNGNSGTIELAVNFSKLPQELALFAETHHDRGSENCSSYEYDASADNCTTGMYDAWDVAPEKGTLNTTSFDPVRPSINVQLDTHEYGCTLHFSASDDRGVNISTLSVLVDGGEMLHSCTCNYNSTHASCGCNLAPLAYGAHSVRVSIRDSGHKISAADAVCQRPVMGGGGAVPTETPTPTPTPPAMMNATKFVGEIRPGESKVVTFNETEISEIRIEVKNLVSGVEIAVRKLAEKPPEVTKPPGHVAGYIIINAKNISDENVKNATIKFRVSKSWIANESIDENSVALLRYNESARNWSTLKTVKAGGDGASIFYEAKTPGFSIFAIAGEKAEAKATPTKTPVATPSPTPSPTPTITLTPSPPPAYTPTPKPIPSFSAALAICLLIITASAKSLKRGRGNVKL